MLTSSSQPRVCVRPAVILCFVFDRVGHYRHLASRLSATHAAPILSSCRDLFTFPIRHGCVPSRWCVIPPLRDFDRFQGRRPPRDKERCASSPLGSGLALPVFWTCACTPSFTRAPASLIKRRPARLPFHNHLLRYRWHPHAANTLKRKRGVVTIAAWRERYMHAHAGVSVRCCWPRPHVSGHLHYGTTVSLMRNAAAAVWRGAKNGHLACPCMNMMSSATHPCQYARVSRVRWSCLGGNEERHFAAHARGIRVRTRCCAVPARNAPTHVCMTSDTGRAGRTLQAGFVSGAVVHAPLKRTRPALP